MDEQRFSPDGQWWWNGREWVPANQAPATPRPARRVSTGRKVLLGFVGAVALLLMGLCAASVASSLGSGSQRAGQKAVAAATAAARPATVVTPAAPTVLLDMTGSGAKNSVEFTAPGHWKLHYAYDCTDFGSKGNFQVYVEEGSSPVDVPVNELGLKGDSTTDVYHGGRVHLSMNSECSWHVTATT